MKKWFSRLFGKTEAMSYADFTDHFAKELRQAQPDLEVTIVTEGEIRIENDQGLFFVMHLDNAFSHYKSHPETLSGIVEIFIKSVAQAVQPGGMALQTEGRIIPVIKNKGWLDDVRRQLSQLESDPTALEASLDYAYEVYNDELLVVYAEDRDENMRYLMRSEIEALGLSSDEVRELAMTNLRNCVSEVGVEHTSNFSVISAGETYEASMLLMDELWDDEQFAPGEGELLVAIPSRSMLMFTRNEPEKAKALRLMADVAYKGEDYSLTNRIFVRRDGKFLPFD